MLAQEQPKTEKSREELLSGQETDGVFVPMARVNQS
jgi:hypothetical protein